MRHFEATTGRRIQLKGVKYIERTCIQLEFTEGFSSPIFGNPDYGPNLVTVDASPTSMRDLSIENWNKYDHESLKAPNTHEYIGVTGYVSKTGELNHLALITWVLPVEAMDDESQRSLHEGEALVEVENKKHRERVKGEIFLGSFMVIFFGFVGLFMIFWFTGCIGGIAFGGGNRFMNKLWEVIKFLALMYLPVPIGFWIFSCYRLSKPKY